MKRRIGLDALLLLGGIALALGIGELGLRLFWPQRSGVTLGMFRADQASGFSLRPGYENEIRLPEYHTSIRIDADGYRIPAAGATAPGRDPRRVLMIGDSFTFGVGVEAEEAFPARVQAAHAGEEEWHVRNGGVGGFGPLRSARLLQVRQASWEPEVVVHTLFLGNDLEDPRPADFLDVPQVRHGRLVSAERPRLLRWRLALRVHSHLYAFLRDRMFGLYVSTGFADRSRYLDSFGLTEWPAEIVDESQPAAFAAIAEIRDWCADRDIPYLLVLAPPRWQVRDESWERYRLAWGLSADAFDRDRLSRVAQESLRELGIEAVDLREPLRAAEAAGTPCYYEHDAHWNQAGHALAAEVILRALEAREWPVPRSAQRAVAERDAPSEVPPAG